MPESPNGPATFVSDALYLRQNILQGGGASVISKYSGRNPGVESGNRTPKSNSAKRLHNVRRSTGTSFSHGRSAAKFLQEQGGIDHIIQEAAKGVYSRGEKWGVNKALRGAIEGLQSGTNASRKQSDGSRWSLDEGKVVRGRSEVTANLEAMEQRNKSLAKLLGTAMEELWDQQRQLNQGKEDFFANVLSVAIAKVQFVQVYLENPSMPFSMDSSTAETVVVEGQKDVIHANTAPGGVEAINPQSVDEESKPEETDAQSIGRSRLDIGGATEVAGESTAASEPEITVSKSHSQALPFHHPRPSLAQSSFSWMLGEDQRKSSFVSPSPFPSDRRAAREKAGFLFGEGKKEAERKAQKVKAEQESDDEEVINLSTIKGCS